MKHLTKLLIPIALGLVASCAQQREAIDRVQPDYQDKSFYVGDDLVSIADDPEFYMRGTLIDVGYGAKQSGLFNSTYAQPVTRIKWEITEDFLNARLAYERIEGSDNQGNPMSGTGLKAANDGLIVASYFIKSHFDIIQRYNDATGELMNVIEENTIDRPWYERDYIRVEWSLNFAGNNYEYDTLSMLGVYGGVHYEPLAYTILDPSHPDAPFFDEATGYFDVTNKVFASPGMIDLSALGWGIDAFPTCWLPDEFFGGSWPDGQCGPVEMTLRNSFKRVVDTDYEPFSTDGFRFQAYGNFLAERFGFDPQYGVVDTKWLRFAARYNIYDRNHYYEAPAAMTGAIVCNTEETTERGLIYLPDGTADVANDPNVDPNRDTNDDGTADECEAVTDATGMGGSQCDIFKKKCTLPYRLRETATIPWYINYITDDEDLFEASDWAVQEWDLALKSAVQVARLVECYRTTDEGGHENCREAFPMWAGQHDATDSAMRLTQEYVHCQRTDGWHADSCATELRNLADGYATEMGGAGGEQDAMVSIIQMDSIITLCHNPVIAEDHASCGAVGLEARKGDLRYHAINVIDTPQSPSPWGIMVNAVDPYWGEHIATSANIWDNITNRAAQGFIDEIRYVNGELPTSAITDGDYVRDWAAAQSRSAIPTMGKKEINRRLAAATKLTGEEFEMMSQYEMPDHIRAMIDGVEEDYGDTATMAGAPSQARAVASARMRAARGSLMEAELMNPAMQQLAGIPGEMPIEGAIAQHASPLSLNNPRIASDMQRLMHNALAERGACLLQEAPEPTSLSGMSTIMNRKFPAVDGETQSDKKDRYERMLRYMRRRLHYGVIAHEIGHSVGHRHNFVSSSDALFYRPQYWQLRTRNGQVTTPCTDAVANGADCVGPRFFDPVTNDEQSQLIHMFQQSSSMDYPGDVAQDMIGLGAWDFAATRFFYGDNVSVYASGLVKAGTPIGQGVARATDTFGGLFGITFNLGNNEFHYSELQNNYNVIWGCYDVEPTAPSWWNTEIDGIWDEVLDGHIVSVDGQATKCRQMAVDYAAWNDLREPTPAEVGGFYRGGPSIDPQDRPRVPYGFATDSWADLGNASVYRHDNGADPYEIASFLINKQENRHIFDNFRRNRTNFSIRAAANRAFGRYNEKLLGLGTSIGFYSSIYKNLATSSGITYDTIWPNVVSGGLRDNMVAASLVFDHFVRQLSRPSDGEHYLNTVYNDPTLRSYKDEDDFASDPVTGVPFPTEVVVPNGSTGYLKDVGFGGQPLSNDLENQGEWDTSYTANKGSYYDKINVAILLSESEDRFVSQSRGDFYDARFRAAGMADVFPEGWRRVIANSLINDRSVMAPFVAGNASGEAVTDVSADTSLDPLANLFPARPMGWTSWWPNEGPSVCFATEGRNVCTEYSGEDFDPDLPATRVPVDPQIGWEVQKFIIAWTLAYIPDNQMSQWIDMMRIYRQGNDSTPEFEDRIEWQDPTSGQIYYAQAYGRECLFGTGALCTGGKMVERGVAGRILEYAGELTGKGYKLDTVNYPATAWYPAGFNDYGRPIVIRHPDGNPVVKAGPGMIALTPEWYVVPVQDCDQNISPACEQLEIWANNSAVELQKYKSVPDYLWEVMKAYNLATADQLGIWQ